jgi:exopolysaccharide biosynthesis polyprenyl glycosylphosphotransferase
MQQKKKIHFEISERKILLRIFDVLSVVGFIYLIAFFFEIEYFDALVSNINFLIVLGFYINIIGTVFEMYNLQVASKQFQILQSILLTASTSVLLYLLTPILTPLLPKNRLQIIYFFILVFGALYLWRYFYVKLLASTRFLKNAILICDKDQLEELVLGIENADPHYKILGYINSDVKNHEANLRSNFVPNIEKDSIKDFVSKNSISEIVIASQKTDGITSNLYSQLIQLLEKGFIIREYTQVYESITQSIPVQYIAKDFYRYFPFSRSNQNKLYLVVIRFLEIITSIIGLLIGTVILPLILLGNLLGNRGKIFYTQKRVGQNGKVFKILKLRTMIKNAEKNGAVFSQKNDIRITAFGKFLRKSRLDEVPQFVNVLKGEMAIIGPRPERPVFVKEISDIMPFYETRHVIKPGLTGWAQVNYSYGATIDDSLMKLQYDLYYIKHRSIFLDINIVFKTLSTIVFYRGQ